MTGVREDLRGWLSLPNINAVIKIRKISLVLDQKYFGSFEMLCWKKDGGDQLDRSCENEVLRRGKEERNILLAVQRRKANWIGHILCGNWLLKHVIE